MRRTCAARDLDCRRISDRIPHWQCLRHRHGAEFTLTGICAIIGRHERRTALRSPRRAAPHPSPPPQPQTSGGGRRSARDGARTGRQHDADARGRTQAGRSAPPRRPTPLTRGAASHPPADPPDPPHRATTPADPPIHHTAPPPRPTAPIHHTAPAPRPTPRSTTPRHHSCGRPGVASPASAPPAGPAQGPSDHPAPAPPRAAGRRATSLTRPSRRLPNSRRSA